MAKHPYLPRSLRYRVTGMPRLQRVLWVLEAAVISGLRQLLRLLGPDRSVRTVRAVMSRIGPRFPKSQNIRDNLAVMFPERSPEERAALERKIWGEWGAAFADFSNFERICADPGRVEIVQRVPIPTLSGRTHPTVFVSTHLVNPDLTVWATSQLGCRVTALYTPLSNPIVDRMIHHNRSANTNLVDRAGGMRALLRELGNGGAVGLVVDNRYDEGEMVPFFGVATPTVTTPARLALRFECDLVPVRVERLGDGAHFRVTFYEPVEPRDPNQDRAEQAFDMTRQLNALFERWIRERPEQWVVAKRRWPRGAPTGPRAEPRPPAGGALPARREDSHPGGWIHSG